MGNGNPIDIAELAAGYDEKRRMNPADFERLLGLIVRQGEIKGRVLDVGCGTGLYLVPLAQELPDSVNIELRHRWPLSSRFLLRA